MVDRERLRNITEADANKWKRLHVLEAENARLLEFSRWCVTESCFNGADLYGGDVQEKAVDAGIIKAVPFDPAIHDDQGLGAEIGETWYEFVTALKESS